MSALQRQIGEVVGEVAAATVESQMKEAQAAAKVPSEEKVIAEASPEAEADKPEKPAAP